MTRRRVARVFLAGLSCALAACVSPVVGPEFQVNTTTAGTQSAPSVANAGPDSNFVVVWTAGGGQDGHLTGVFARLFDASGAPLTGEFLVNVVTTGEQDRPSVASNVNGDFVVTWTHLDAAASYEVRARLFNSSGTPQGGEILVNTHTTGSQVVPAAILDNLRNFVVVWASGQGQDGDGYGIYGRRFAANGDPLTAEFRVNQATTGSQSRPRIALSYTQDFIVVWQSPQDGSESGVMARLYSSSTNPLGDEFQVNTTEAFAQEEPDVAFGEGSPIVVWTSEAQDGDGNGIYGQRLDASGDKIGPEFNVHTFTTAFQGQPRIAASPHPTHFTVTWQSNGQEGDPGIFSQEYEYPTRRYMGEQPVNSYVTAAQIQPAVAGQPNGQFVAAWSSEGFDGSEFGISARVAGFPQIRFTWVDAHFVAPSGNSNRNGVLEAGEQVIVEPVYNLFPEATPFSLTGTMTDITGFPGPTYSIIDDTINYGMIGGQNSNCYHVTHDCYEIAVDGSRPDEQHADVQIFEELSYHGFTRTDALHIGGSFADVPLDNPFYAFIENLFHNDVTGGCAGGGYCPANPVTRAQMAVFLLKANQGAGYIPAPATGTAFPDVPADNPFAPWIEELVREGITAGCGNGNYCPNNPVTRQQMAVFLIKTKYGAAYVPQDGVGLFGDVSPCPGVVCNFIEDLYNEGITGGCNLTPLLYCPGNSVVRQQMAAFLVKTFELRLY